MSQSFTDQSVNQSVSQSVSQCRSQMARSWNHLKYQIRRHRPTATDVQQNTSLTKCPNVTAAYVKAFFSETTVHGLQYTVESDRHPVER